jgi:hypothetical protein
MATNSPAARRVVLGLLARGKAPSAAASEGSDAVAVEGSDAVAVTEEVFRHFANGLTRWFGSSGYHALFSRALVEAKSHHPALANVRIRSATEPSLEGLAECIEQHGTNAVTEGIIAMLMALIDLLGRLIGEDMALKLVDQSVPLRGPETDVPEKEAAS